MLKLLGKLYRVGLLAPRGLIGLVIAIGKNGINLMTLLHLAARLHGDKPALADELTDVSFEELLYQTQKLAAILNFNYQIEARSKVALLCRNHASLVKSIFAASRLGADVYLLNAEMSRSQFESLAERHQFDLLIYDAEVNHLLENSIFKGKLLITYGEAAPSIHSLSLNDSSQFPALPRVYSSSLIILTGGTTGQPKLARRKPSIFNFLNPFFALLTELNLDTYKSVYIATPIYHGFGVAAVFLALILGIKMYLMRGFEVQQACDLIRENNIETVTLVPLMLQRTLHFDAAALGSLQCIITGGAPLSPALAEAVLARLGDKLFNLYGTSEAGFSIMATPADLRSDSRTVGKKIRGVKLKILDADNREAPDGEIGRICIKSKWTMNNGGEGWIETGDVGYRNKNERYFLCGRSDEMIVSGGENVYPIELENVLEKHPNIRQVAVIGVPDAEFGQRLKAFVVPNDDAVLSQNDVLDWLAGRVARFQMPIAVVVLDDLPITHLGKPNKKLLS